MQSTTDPDARLYKKGGGHEAKLAYLGHLLTENRHGLIVDTAVTAATGTAERDAAIVMLGELPLTSRRVTVGADKLYDTRDVGRRRAPDGHHAARRARPSIAAAAVPSTGARCATPAMPSANASGSWSSKPSAG